MRAILILLAVLCALLPVIEAISQSRLFEESISPGQFLNGNSCSGTCLFLVYTNENQNGVVSSIVNLVGVSYQLQIQPGMHYVLMTNDAADSARAQSGVIWIRQIPAALKIDRALQSRLDLTFQEADGSTTIYTLLNIRDEAGMTPITAFLTTMSTAMTVIGVVSVDSYATKSNKIATTLPLTQLKKVVEWLSGQQLVQWVEERKSHTISNKFAHLAVQSTDGKSSPIWDKGIDGTNEVIGVADTGLDYDSCFFKDTVNAVKICPTGSRTGKIKLGDESKCTADANNRKVILYRWYEDQALLVKASPCTGNWPCRTSNVGDTSSGHGTHVTGSVAGKASSSLPTAQLLSQSFNGAAPSAKIVFDDISPGDYTDANNNKQTSLEAIPDDLETGLFPITYNANANARIHTNSWGAQTNTYTTFSQEVDSFMYKNDDFLVLVAAGNSGSSLGTVGSPATMKNGIAVGATSNTAEAGTDYGLSENLDMLRLMSFSSRGPTSDLRIKPDILCPGYQIKSAKGDGDLNSNQCGTGTEMLLSGTSMATPLCAGSVALVRQYLREGWFQDGTKATSAGISPSASLLKAFMIHSGRPVKVNANSAVSQSVNVHSGYGLVDLSSVLYFPESTFKLWMSDKQVMTDGAIKTYAFTVEAGVKFRASLVWTDPPGQPAASFTLQNNLDLVVQGPIGTANSAFYYGNGFVTKTEVHTIQEFDSYNPSEQVTLYAPAAGTYKVQVRGVKLSSNQKYSLVVTGKGLTQGADAAISECPQGCSGKGTCSEGRCTCNIDMYGDDCSLAIPQLIEGAKDFTTDKKLTVTANGWGYYIFYKARADATYTLTFSGSNDADYYIGYQRRPTTTTFDLVDAREGSAGSLTISSSLPRGFYILGVLAFGNGVGVTVKVTSDDDKCGDGIKQASEQCDDGNVANGDSCTWYCKSGAGSSSSLQPSEPGNMYGSNPDGGAGSKGGGAKLQSSAPGAPRPMMMNSLLVLLAGLITSYVAN